MHSKEDNENPITVRYENFEARPALAADFLAALRRTARQVPGFISAVGSFRLDPTVEDLVSYRAHIMVKALSGHFDVHAESSSLSQCMWAVSHKLKEAIAELQIEKTSRDFMIHKSKELHVL